MAKKLNLTINPINVNINIKTCKTGSTIQASGIVNLGGFIKDMYVVPDTMQSILSVNLLQSTGLTLLFQAAPIYDCIISTHTGHK
jgi:hypothetical protein